MPKKVHDLAMKLKAKGYSEGKAWAIANSQFGPKRTKKKSKRTKKG